MFSSAPNSSFGYYRGMTNLYGGGAYGGGGYGNTVAGNGVFAQGTGTPSTGQAGGWTPTILYMFALIIVEMIIFGILSRKL
jgi:hypothetical protein